MGGIKMNNPSAKRHRNWEVRGVVGGTLTIIAGVTVHLFEFREKRNACELSIHVFRHQCWCLDKRRRRWCELSNSA